MHFGARPGPGRLNWFRFGLKVGWRAILQNLPFSISTGDNSGSSVSGGSLLEDWAATHDIVLPQVGDVENDLYTVQITHDVADMFVLGHFTLLHTTAVSQRPRLSLFPFPLPKRQLKEYLVHVRSQPVRVPVRPALGPAPLPARPTGAQVDQLHQYMPSFFRLLTLGVLLGAKRPRDPCPACQVPFQTSTHLSHPLQ